MTNELNVVSKDVDDYGEKWFADLSSFEENLVSA